MCSLRFSKEVLVRGRLTPLGKVSLVQGFSDLGWGSAAALGVTIVLEPVGGLLFRLLCTSEDVKHTLINMAK